MSGPPVILTNDLENLLSPIQAPDSDFAVVEDSVWMNHVDTVSDMKLSGFNTFLR